MTATPLREDNRDTYRYFGNPIYTYSLRQGIEDGFLAPYRVHRIITEWDAAGWRPSKGDLDRYGRDIPDAEYQTVDFERAVALKARSEAIARNLTDFLKKTDRFAKTIVFCVDQEHADEMRRALNNLNNDLAKQYPDYVCRITSEEGTLGRGYLSKFQELETITPAIVTTSQLLTTGVDIPTCKNIVIARVVNSMVEFKQIIGRGTRVRDDYNKLYFNILDYTGSATRLFADPDFDGEPAYITEQEMNETGETIKEIATEKRMLPNKKVRVAPSLQTILKGLVVSTISTAARWKSLLILSTSWTLTAGNCVWLSSLNMLPRKFERFILRRPICGSNGPIRRCALKSSVNWKREESISIN
jgi:type I restriction enzyme R subunit